MKRLFERLVIALEALAEQEKHRQWLKRENNRIMPSELRHSWEILFDGETNEPVHECRYRCGTQYPLACSRRKY